MLYRCADEDFLRHIIYFAIWAAAILFLLFHFLRRFDYARRAMGGCFFIARFAY